MQNDDKIFNFITKYNILQLNLPKQTFKRKLEQKQKGVNFFLVFVPYLLIAGFAFFIMIRNCLKSNTWQEIKRRYIENKKRSLSNSNNNNSNNNNINNKNGNEKFENSKLNISKMSRKEQSNENNFK